MGMSTNFARKICVVASMAAVMVIMTGCGLFKERQSNTLGLKAGVALEAGTTAGADSENAKPESCCQKSGAKPANVKNECATPNAPKTFGKPANVKNECATPNSAGCSCCKTKCECKDCKCCTACKTGKTCDCVDCKCCAACKAKKAAAAAAATAPAATKCDCTECKCCPACKSGGKCECKDCQCCKNCPKK